MAELLADPAVQANPSSVHRPGQRARAVVEQARRRVAAAVGAEPLGVTFTSGGTQADNLAVLGSGRALRAAGRPDGVLSSPLEHPAVLAATARLEHEGHPRVLVDVDSAGRIRPEAVAAALEKNPELGLVSLATVNHELGNLYDIPAMVEAARAVRPEVVFHTDAVQALGKVPVDLAAWDVDLLSVSAHKIYGPKGVGALVHRTHQRLDPLEWGGHQERGRRPGTENVVGIHGFGLAAQLVAEELPNAGEVRALRELLVEGLRDLAGCEVLGDPELTVGNTVLIRFEDCDGEMLLINLDLEDIAVSTGSACTAGTLEPSPVVLALGLPESAGRSTLRVSLGRGNTQAEVVSFLALLGPIVERVRGAK